MMVPQEPTDSRTTHAERIVCTSASGSKQPAAESVLPENALRTTAAGRFRMPFSWNKP